MPDARELTRMLKDFREYIPAVVGAIVVIATVIGLLVPNLEGGSRSADDANRSSPVEWCNRFVSFGLGYALSWSGVSSCWVGCGVSRDVVRMSRLR